MKFLLRFTALPALFLFLIGFCFVTNVISQETNLLPNGDLETVAPAFWNELNAGAGTLTWDMATGHNGSRCLKVEKTAASTDVVGWKSDDNAYLYWNGAKADRLYNLNFWAKTDGVNTSPANDDATVGILFAFYAGGTLLGEQLVPVDQTAATTDWNEYTAGLLIPAGTDPDAMYMTCQFGKDATGTAWFDDVGCGCDPWAMWPFNGNFETPTGWTNWYASGGGFANTVNDTAYSGEWSTLLYEWDDNDDEMVFNSNPVAAEPNTWYKISVIEKCDSVNTDDSYLPSNITGNRDNNRLGMCFFFHKTPIDKSWDLTGGDQYYYFNQRDSVSDWTEYSVISKSPEDAAGVSCRARFTSNPVGKVWYDDFSIKQVDLVEVPTGVSDPANYGKFELPKEFVLSQNYPNPFNPTTTIGYSTPRDGEIQIEIYNLMGQKVRTLFNGILQAGSHKVEWDGCDDSGKTLSSGVYLITLRSGNFVTAKRMSLIK